VRIWERSPGHGEGVHPRRRRACGRRAGFTMIEVGLALTVLLIAIMAASASSYRLHTLRRQNRERTMAQNGVRTMVEQIQALAHRGALDSPDTWAQDVVAALSPGGAIGDAFAVRELDPQNGQTSVGTIQVFTDETSSDAVTGFDLGMPRDLNGDGLADNADVLATAAVLPPRILPVVVTVRWRGVNGNSRIVHPFYVIGY
jgi:Tfp pilus assembly protein PilV